MRKRQTTVVDLHYDILKEILIRVARSSDGAKSLANAISVCQSFGRYVEDKDVLMAVNFSNLSISGRWGLFQLIGGLITRSAQVGHTGAQLIMAKIILVSTSQLFRVKKEENAQVISFMEKLLPEKPYSQTTGVHISWVRLFLSRASLCELEEMQPYLNDYMEYFCLWRGYSRELEFSPSFRELYSRVLKKERDLEYWELELAEASTTVRSLALRYMQMLGMEKQRLRMTQVWAEEMTSSSTLVERVSMSMKHIKTGTAFLEQGFCVVLQQFSAEDAELANACSSLLQRIRKVAALGQNQPLKIDVTMSLIQRRSLILKFDALLNLLPTWDE